MLLAAGELRSPDSRGRLSTHDLFSLGSRNEGLVGFE
jgi:hypothetical protein